MSNAENTTLSYTDAHHTNSQQINSEIPTPHSCLISSYHSKWSVQKLLHLI